MYNEDLSRTYAQRTSEVIRGTERGARPCKGCYQRSISTSPGTGGIKPVLATGPTQQFFQQDGGRAS